MSNWRPKGWENQRNGYFHRIYKGEYNPQPSETYEAGANTMLEAISEEIEKGLLTEQEIRMSCLGEGNYYAGELGNVATEAPPVVMPQFSRVSKAQVKKILALLK